MTDREIIEIIQAYILQKKYIELLEEQIERMLDAKRRTRNTKEKVTEV